MLALKSNLEFAFSSFEQEDYPPVALMTLLGVMTTFVPPKLDKSL